MACERAMWTYYKGDWHEGDVRILGAASHATWLGSLVFDGARLFEGVSPDLDLHCQRINRSAEALMLDPTFTGEEIEALAKDGIKKFAPNTDVYIRPMYWAEESDVGTLPPLASSTDFALCLEEIPMVEPTGFSITTTQFRRPTFAVAPTNAKAACLYANNARMVREAQKKGFDNALVTDCAGNVAELATANVFMVRGGEVFTSIPNGTFLAGITRKRVLGLLRDAGYTVHEMTLTVQDFMEADEIFSTGNISKVIPVSRIEDRELAYGPITKKARSLYMEWAHA
ncbi:branched-chain amino acid aminotransferase [uncultured Cohaesibacter sp.]|uniref:branched-chain amino acid aminotransferase n=1 Tax=uncultured Cohaesibacter sp. TaxID=1002546 RepID=UPI002AA5E9A7|nr:branched-chain amino acid aminotransferase [uncultured Cohaesibacter sp.]